MHPDLKRNFLNKPLWLFIDIFNGFYYHIPVCCNLQWSWEIFWQTDTPKITKRNPYLRGLCIDLADSVDYIPCTKCLRKMADKLGPDRIRENLLIVESNIRRNVFHNHRKKSLEAFRIANNGVRYTKSSFSGIKLKNQG